MKKVLFSTVMLLCTLSIQGCDPEEIHEEAVLYGQTVSICSTTLNSPNTGNNAGSLRLLLNDQFGSTIDERKPVEFYPNNRACISFTPTPPPEEDCFYSRVRNYRYCSDRDGIVAWYLNSPSRGQIDLSPIYVNELVLEIEGRRIGGGIERIEQQGANLRIDASFDFANTLEPAPLYIYPDPNSKYRVEIEPDPRSN